MTKVKFFADSKRVLGFKVSGHSSINCDDENGKLVCAAVSSAAYMAANTILEIVGDESYVDVDDAELELRVKNPSEQTDVVLLGFKLHMEQLSKQYSNHLYFGGVIHVKD